jgi:hypothetical protein
MKIAPLLKHQATAIVVKGDAEDQDVEYITGKQKEMVWNKDVGGCASWVIFFLIILMEVL